MKELKDKLVKSMLEHTKYVPSEYENRLSASEVSSDFLELYLKRKHKVKDTKVGQATIGSLVHAGLEDAFKFDEFVLTEEPMSCPIPETKSMATATVDYIDKKDKVVIDWKVTKEYTLKMVKAAIKKGDLFGNGYIMQMNHQAYKIGRAHV